MKKVLSIAAILVLVIALAITSTVAIYSSSVGVGGDGPNTITAKKFYIGAEKGEQAFVNSAIAPGETIDWDFTVSNQKAGGNIAAVDMDMMVTVDITTDITNLTVKLIAIDDKNVESIQATLNKKLVQGTYHPEAPAFTATLAKTYKFIIRIEWPLGADADTGADTTNGADTENGEKENTATIKVTVVGAQSVK